VGEKTPVPENCKTIGDDDCDGSLACTCAPTWEKVFGSQGDDDIGAVAVDGDGNVYIAARYNGTVTLPPNAVHTSQGKLDVLVAKIGPSGSILWSKSFGGSENDQPLAVAVTAAGQVVVGGLFEGNVNFGAGPVNAPGGAAFVLRLQADGTFSHMVMLNGTVSELLLDLAVDAAGNAYAVGQYEGTLSAGATSVNAIMGVEGYVVKVSPGATVDWVNNVTGAGEQRVAGAAVDASGNVYITGAFENTIDVGSGAHVSMGGHDALLAQLAPATGKANWTKAFGGLGLQAGIRVGVASTDVVIGGEFDGVITVESTKLMENGNGEDIFVARLPASGSGGPQWAKRFGSTEDDRLIDMAIELNANVLLSGSFQASIAFGGPGLSSKGGPDAYFAKLSATGAHQCSRSFGGTLAEAGKAVAAGLAGAAFFAGEFGGIVDFGFGGHAAPASGDLDAFLLRIDP
jgi:hypothetical protein